jgi:hypothetical protein
VYGNQRKEDKMMTKKILALAGVLALIGALVVPTAALAAEDTGTNLIYGAVQESVRVNPPGTFEIPLVMGQNEVGTIVSVDSNADGWTLTAVEYGVSPDGCMTHTTSGTLTWPMLVFGGDMTIGATLDTPQTIEDGLDSVAGTTSIAVSFGQFVEPVDGLGSYTITILWTASVSPP